MSIQIKADSLVESEATGSQFQHAAATAPDRPGAEVYDALLWRLIPRGVPADRRGLLIGLTGASRQTGVSTLAANLAIRAADHGLGPVLLVDCNVHNPRLGELICKDRAPGLADLLASHAELGDCVHATSVAGLHVLPLGAAERLDRICLDPPLFRALAERLREEFQFVVCDLPEANRLAHATLLAAEFDSSLLVIRAERVRKSEAQQAVRRLTADNVRLIGAVLTDERKYVPSWFDQMV